MKNKYKTDLSKLDLSNHNNLNTNELTQLFHSHFIKTYNTHAPLKVLSIKASKTRLKPWLTTAILKSISIKRKLLSQYNRKKDPSLLTTVKIYRKQLKKLIRINKKNFYRKYFTENVKNIKKSWKQINHILHRNKSNQVTSQLLINNTLTSNKKHMANAFNKYFTNVAIDLSKKISKPNNSFQDYLKNPNEHSIFLTETTQHEISTIINSLNNSSASDIYGITTKFVKIANPSICPNLSIIFNSSIHQGIFPQIFKLTKVIPLFKSNSPLSVSNYRPISLLPILSKVFERLMYNRLLSFIGKNNILTPNQFGFQTKKSTELAVNEICTNIKNTYENKETAFCIFLDFAKAFDTVNH